eukprot:TRINITY_DN3423_c0_g1_i1.p1 TRINITY_DN3423_c0_g1~~TRINITY_DN3423_c0_g1_i1.p1  ORF type:complete len:154 (-),score=8.53 TRINITY_DN3423_c0_g1_i1:141-602(-)
MSSERADCQVGVVVAGPSPYGTVPPPPLNMLSQDGHAYPRAPPVGGVNSIDTPVPFVPVDARNSPSAAIVGDVATSALEGDCAVGIAIPSLHAQGAAVKFDPIPRDRRGNITGPAGLRGGARDSDTGLIICLCILGFFLWPLWCVALYLMLRD